MTQKVFAVVLDKPQPEVKQRLDKKYANILQYTDTFHLVPVDSQVTTKDVARTAGIKGNNRDATGVVFKLNSVYSGYTKASLWAWLSDVEGS